MSWWRKMLGIEEKANAVHEASVSGALEAMGAPMPVRVQKPLDAFTFHVWSYACAMRTAQAVAMCTLRAFSKTSGTELPIESVTARAEFAQPNPVTSIYDHIELLVIDGLMTGNTYEFIADDGLWRLDPRRLKVVPGKTERIKHYEYHVDGRKLILHRDLVIHRKWANPTDDWYGIGPGSVALEEVKLDQQMEQYSRSYFENGVNLGLILSTDAELTLQQKRKMVREVTNLYAGSKNAFKTIALSHGMKATPTGSTNRDLEFSQGRADIRDRIITAYNMPPILVGVYDEANYANSLQQLKIFFYFTVKPLQRKLTLGWEMNRVLFPVPGKVELRFDTKELKDMLVDELAAASAATTLYNAGLYGRDHLREKFFHDGPVDGDEQADIKAPPPVPTGFSQGGGSFSEEEKMRRHLRALARARRENRRKLSENEQE